MVIVGVDFCILWKLCKIKNVCNYYHTHTLFNFGNAMNLFGANLLLVFSSDY